MVFALNAVDLEFEPRSRQVSLNLYANKGNNIKQERAMTG